MRHDDAIASAIARALRRFNFYWDSEFAEDLILEVKSEVEREDANKPLHVKCAIAAVMAESRAIDAIRRRSAHERAMRAVNDQPPPCVGPVQHAMRAENVSVIAATVRVFEENLRRNHPDLMDAHSAMMSWCRGGPSDSFATHYRRHRVSRRKFDRYLQVLRDWIRGPGVAYLRMESLPTHASWVQPQPAEVDPTLPVH